MGHLQNCSGTAVVYTHDPNRSSYTCKTQCQKKVHALYSQFKFLHPLTCRCIPTLKMTPQIVLILHAQLKTQCCLYNFPRTVTILFMIGTGERNSSHASRGSSSGFQVIVGGSASGALLFICVAILVVVVICVFLKWRTKSRVKKFQMGIFSM